MSLFEVIIDMGELLIWINHKDHSAPYRKSIRTSRKSLEHMRCGVEKSCDRS